MTHKSNQVEERPIIFGTDMVQAILNGRKTQTRRVNKLVPSWDHYGKDIMDWPLSEIFKLPEAWNYLGFYPNNTWVVNIQSDVDDTSRLYIKCPYGVVGDRLWVREMHRPMGWNYDDNVVTIEYKDGTKLTKECYPSKLYPADHEEKALNYFEKITKELDAKNCPMVSGEGINWQYDEVYDAKAVEQLLAWRSPIFMPRWATRLLLEITDIRVERLQDISDADAKAEGFDNKYMFQQKWLNLYGWHGEKSWCVNPWVWVIEFEVVEGVA